MKKTLAFMIMAAALLLTQCKKPSITFPTPSETTTVSMTITAGPGSKTDISTMGGIVWSENDRIYVGDGSKYVGYLTIVSGVGNATGTFTGDVTVATGNDRTFHFYYLGSSDYAGSLASGTSTTVDVDFSSQNIYEDNNHKLKNASGQHVGYGKAEHVNVEADKPVMGLEVTMKSKVAIAYFCFQKGEGESVTPYTGTLTLSGEHIYNKMTVKFNASDFDFTPVKDGCISLTNTTTHLKYAMLVPAGTSAATLNFVGGAGTTVLENGIEANKFYRVDGSMPIPVTINAYVDLGVSVKWATCNLGASKPEEYGDYYAWGATETWYSAGGQSGSPTWKDGYSDGYVWKHCPGNGGNSSYNAGAFNTWKAANLTNNVLKPEVDAAHANWGEPWRMPTTAEWQELAFNTYMKWEYDYAGTGVAGFIVYKVKNESDKCLFTADINDNPEEPAWVTINQYGEEAVLSGEYSLSDVHLFMPAAGYRDGTSLEVAGSHSDYWSSSFGTSAMIAYYAYCGNRYGIPSGQLYRPYGLSVRPVR